MLLHVKQRPHPTPTLQGESCVNLIISETIGKTKNKTTKEVKAKTIKNNWENQNETKKTTFGPMTLFGDIGPKVLFFPFFVPPMVFNCFCFGLFGCFGFVVFSMVFDMFNRVHGQTR